MINFAQGEMAMFTTYIAWTLTANHGWNDWLAYGATLVLAFLGGVAIERTVIRPVEGGSLLTIVIITIGLVLVFNGLAAWIWTAEVRFFPSPFPNETVNIGGVAISVIDLGTIAVVLVMVALLWAFFQFTKIGLALRASALDPRPAASSASAWGGCSRSAGGSRRCSAPSRGSSPRRRRRSTRR